jgi:hypothetical protein
MRKRRRLLLGAAAIALLAAVLMHPLVYWPLVGRLRGEPFWRGRPASSAAARIPARHRPATRAGRWIRNHLPRWWMSILEGDGDLAFDDPGAVPVLRARLRHPDRAVSWAA